MATLVLDSNALAIYRRLSSYAFRYWPMLSAGVLGMIVFAASEVGLAALVKPLLDESFVERDPESIAIMPVLIVALFVIRGIADITQNYYMNGVAWQVIKTLRSQVFEHYLHAPTRYFDRSSSGVLLSRLTYNTEQVAQSTTSVLTIVIRDTLTIAGLLAYMFYLNAALSLFVLVLGPLVGALVRLVGARLRRYSSRIQYSMGDVTRVGEEAIVAHRVIKIFNAQQVERDKFEAVNEQNRRLHLKLVATKEISVSVIQVIASLALAGVVYVATREDASLTVGTFISFLGAMLFLMGPLKRITQLNAPIQQGIAAGDSIFRLLDEPREDEGGRVSIARARGEVAFRGVCFAYAGDKGEVLHDIDLEVNVGERIAIVGRSGSGKSTLVNLLPRFYDPQSGGVFVDGVDVRQYRLVDLRRQIGLVAQDVTLFNDTIARNIAYGALERATEKGVEAAARAAHVLEFATQLPEGLNTVVGDRGVLLSGGQRQRIAIARALLKDAPILILDEAMSALDSESERRIQQALERLMHGRTTLVIAHRLSTVENAHRIVVLDRGRIVESGTHQELMDNNGQYASLYRMQFADATAEDSTAELSG